MATADRKEDCRIADQLHCDGIFSCSSDNSKSTEAFRFCHLQPARAAEENRRLVADELAAAVGQDWWAAGQACQVLLVVAGRGTSAPAAVWPDAAADLGAAGAIGLALRLRLQNLRLREEGRSSV
jgi:hypothetical protein